MRSSRDRIGEVLRKGVRQVDGVTMCLFVAVYLAYAAIEGLRTASLLPVLVWGSLALVPFVLFCVGWMIQTPHGGRLL